MSSILGHAQSRQLERAAIDRKAKQDKAKEYAKRIEGSVYAMITRELGDEAAKQIRIGRIGPVTEHGRAFGAFRQARVQLVDKRGRSVGVDALWRGDYAIPGESAHFITTSPLSIKIDAIKAAKKVEKALSR